jgi:hypothetical protein
MRRNQNQRDWSLGVFIKFLAIPVVLMTLLYLSKNSVSREQRNDLSKNDDIPGDITCLRHFEIPQICCEASGSQQIQELKNCLSQGGNTRFYHNDRRDGVSNLNIDVHDEELLLNCLTKEYLKADREGQKIMTMVVGTRDVSEFANFCYRRS